MQWVGPGTHNKSYALSITDVTDVAGPTSPTERTENKHRGKKKMQREYWTIFLK